MLSSYAEPRPLLISVPVPTEYVREALSLYNNAHIFVDNVDIMSGEISATFPVPHYPFTRPSILPYLTAPLAMLLVSQLGYVFIRLVLDGKIEIKGFSPSHSLEFFQLRDDGDILIAAVKRLCFRRKIAQGEQLCWRLGTTRVLTVRGMIHAHTTFCTSNNEVSGHLHIAVNEKNHERR